MAAQIARHDIILLFRDDEGRRFGVQVASRYGHAEAMIAGLRSVLKPGCTVEFEIDTPSRFTPQED